MAYPCPHCGQPVQAPRDEALEAEADELRAYCTHLERVVSSEITASAVIHDLRSVLMALGALLERDLETGGGAGSQARHAADLARQLVTHKEPQGTADSCRPNEILVRLQHVIGVLVQGQLVLELGPDVGTVPMAPLRLQRVILNLVANAGEAAGPQGTVRVATAREGSTVVLTVSDDGAGIAPENRHKVGRPAFTTKEDGTGLGLALASRVVKNAGGHLQATSRPQGGTTMRVELPTEAVKTADAP